MRCAICHHPLPAYDHGPPHPKHTRQQINELMDKVDSIAEPLTAISLMLLWTFRDQPIKGVPL